MRHTIKFANREIRICVVHLCSIDSKGDYQIIPDDGLPLDMNEVANKLCRHGLCCDNALPEVCLLRWNELDVTVYPGGHLLLQHVVPDSVDKAISLGTQLYGMMFE